MAYLCQRVLDCSPENDPRQNCWWAIGNRLSDTFPFTCEGYLPEPALPPGSTLVAKASDCKPYDEDGPENLELIIATQANGEIWVWESNLEMLKAPTKHNITLMLITGILLWAAMLVVAEIVNTLLPQESQPGEPQPPDAPLPVTTETDQPVTE